MIGADVGRPSYFQCDFPSSDEATKPASLTPTTTREFSTRGNACKRCSTFAIEAPESFCQSGSSALLVELSVLALQPASHAVGARMKRDRRRFMVRCSPLGGRESRRRSL